MPRIRSIKPDFWKSEAIAMHPHRTRLTFIGLWTYVDDNGVGVDNEKLITAELYALEEDPREALAHVREDLARLHVAGRISRYMVDGKRYLSITNWSEHQKVDRPGKARYPHSETPGAVPVSSQNASGVLVLFDPSRESREDVATPHPPVKGVKGVEGLKGAGEQGVPPTAGAVAPHDAKVIDHVPPATAQTLVAEWLDYCTERPPGNVIGQIGKHLAVLLAEGIDPEKVRAGLNAWHHKALHPSTLPSVVNEVMNAATRQPKPGPMSRQAASQAHTDAMFQRAMERAQAREAAAQ